MPITWVITAITYPPNQVNVPFFVALLFLTFSMIVTSVIDLDWKIIPDNLSIPLIIIGLLISPLNPILGGASILHRVTSAILGIIVGGGSLLLIAGIGGLIWKKEVMGLGDVKLLAGIGGFLGWEGTILTLMASSFLSGGLAIIGLIFGVLRRNQYLPFGPFINFSAFLTLIFHEKIPFFFSLFF